MPGSRSPGDCSRLRLEHPRTKLAAHRLLCSDAGHTALLPDRSQDTRSISLGLVVTMVTLHLRDVSLTTSQVSKDMEINLKGVAAVGVDRIHPNCGRPSIEASGHSQDTGLTEQTTWRGSWGRERHTPWPSEFCCLVLRAESCLPTGARGPGRWCGAPTQFRPGAPEEGRARVLAWGPSGKPREKGSSGPVDNVQSGSRLHGQKQDPGNRQSFLPHHFPLMQKQRLGLLR